MLYLKFSNVSSENTYGLKIFPSLLKTFMRKQGFKNKKSWYSFFRAPNNMFACTTAYFTFRVPQIVIRTRVYANVYQAEYLLQRYKYLRVKGSK